MTKKKAASRSQAKRWRAQGREDGPRVYGEPERDVNVLAILDKSGSMLDRRVETVQAFDDYMNTLRKDRHSRYFVTTTLFDTYTVPLYANVALPNVGSIGWAYQPEGWTALLDAVGNTLSGAMERERNLCVIITDGHENASRNWDTYRVHDLIQSKRESGKWEFIFLGATADAWDVGTQLGIYHNIRFEPTKRFYGMAGQSLGSVTMSYSDTGSVDSRCLRSADTHIQNDNDSNSNLAIVKTATTLNEGDEGKTRKATA